MSKKHFLLLFLVIYGMLRPVCGQDITFRDTLQTYEHAWQEQILQRIDIDELGEAAYNELLDELSELVVWSDTTAEGFDLRRLRQNLILSSNRCLNTREGYRNPTQQRRDDSKAYLGDAWRHAIRYRLQHGRYWQAGLTLEKDAGEPWRNRFPVFDSWHGFARMRNYRLNEQLRISDAVIGHYRLRLGCGLVMSQGFSLGKQYLTEQLVGQRTNSITPHASMSEAGFMQGIATDLRIGRHLTLLPYFSARQVDGTLSERSILTALQTDGYHRTTKEEAHRMAAWQFVSGARLGWRGEWFDVGLHGSYTHFQYDYVRQKLYYNSNYFRGHQLTQFSADYTVRALGVLLRGEAALDDHGAMALINAIHSTIGDDWEATLLHRYYDRRYHQLHASSVSESSGMQGEQAILLNVTGQLSRHWQLHSMIDRFWFSQPQYGIRDTTSQGVDASVRLQYSGRRSNTATLGYRIKQKGDYIRHTWDATCTLHPTSAITCRTQLRARIYSKVKQDPTYGFAVSQSAGWQGSFLRPDFPLSVEAQACYFRTDDYDSRVYLTERAVLYGFGLPMLYGEGLRYSLTGTLGMGQRVRLDFKWAMTNYANRATISSGLQQIQGNTQQDLWLQLRVKI